MLSGQINRLHIDLLLMEEILQQAIQAFGQQEPGIIISLGMLKMSLQLEHFISSIRSSGNLNSIYANCEQGARVSVRKSGCS